MLSAKACKAHSGLVCVATWNYHRITSESSSVLRMACCWMTSRILELFTPSLESLSSHADPIAEPLTPTVKLYWAVVQVTPFFRDAHQICSRWRACLMFFSRSLSCAQSWDQSAPVYQLGCSEALSLESIGLVNLRKAHIFAFSLKATPIDWTLRNTSGLVSLKSSASQYPITQWNSLISFPTAELPYCVSVIRLMCARISLIAYSSCLTALTDVGKSRIEIHHPSLLVNVFNVHNHVPPDAMVYWYPLHLQGFAIALYMSKAFWEGGLLRVEGLT